MLESPHLQTLFDLEVTSQWMEHTTSKRSVLLYRFEMYFKSQILADIVKVHLIFLSLFQSLRPYLLDGGVSLLLGVEVPPTDVRTLMGEFLAIVTILLLVVEELLLEDPGL